MASTIQSNSLAAASTSNPVTLAFKQDVTAGNLLVVDMSAIVNQATLDGWEVTDSQGNEYGMATGAGVAESTTPITVGTFWAKAKTSGPCTVTATFSSASPGERLYIAEYPGYDTFDVGTGATGNSNLLTATTPATAHPDELVHACGISNNGVTSPGSGFVMRETGASEGTEDKVVSTAGPQTATFPQGSANAWAIMVTTFYSSGGAPPEPTAHPEVAAGFFAATIGGGA